MVSLSNQERGYERQRGMKRAYALSKPRSN